MSLTAKTLGRGRRAAAGSLIAIAALTLTACQEGSNSAAGPPSASSPETAARLRGRPQCEAVRRRPQAVRDPGALRGDGALRGCVEALRAQIA